MLDSIENSEPVPEPVSVPGVIDEDLKERIKSDWLSERKLEMQSALIKSYSGTGIKVYGVRRVYFENSKNSGNG